MFPPTTAVLDDEHKLTLPDEAFYVGQFQAGEKFRVLVSKNGDVWLRRESPHRLSLLEHLKGMEGLEILRNREVLPPPLSL